MRHKPNNIMNEYQAIRDEFAQAARHAEIAMQGLCEDLARPHVTIRPRIYMDGNQWCALYGNNLQDGVAGFGSSPQLAMLEFDKQWQTNIPNV